jgi:hypothetical protein
MCVGRAKRLIAHVRVHCEPAILRQIQALPSLVVVLRVIIGSGCCGCCRPSLLPVEQVIHIADAAHVPVVEAQGENKQTRPISNERLARQARYARGASW